MKILLDWQIHKFNGKIYLKFALSKTLHSKVSKNSWKKISWVSSLKFSWIIFIRFTSSEQFKHKTLASFRNYQKELNCKMSSTEYNIGLQGDKSSSRVLRPPVSRNLSEICCFEKKTLGKIHEKSIASENMKKTLCVLWSDFLRPTWH